MQACLGFRHSRRQVIANLAAGCKSGDANCHGLQPLLAIADRLAKADPNNAGWQRGLFVSHERVVLVAQGNLLEALKAYRHGSLKW
jgi:hypothetical protein